MTEAEEHPETKDIEEVNRCYYCGCRIAATVKVCDECMIEDDCETC